MNWISTKRKLPDDPSYDLLLYSSKLGILHNACRYKGLWYSGIKVISDDEVTHWCIPTPPNIDKK